MGLLFEKGHNHLKGLAWCPVCEMITVQDITFRGRIEDVFIFHYECLLCGRLAWNKAIQKKDIDEVLDEIVNYKREFGDAKLIRVEEVQGAMVS
ncbi:MAG: hypothetical protein ACTSR2_01805 [Candidatus Hodarchaeales archaeon]